MTMDENAKRWVVKLHGKYLVTGLTRDWTTSQIYASRYTREVARLHAWKHQAAMCRLVSKAEKSARATPPSIEDIAAVNGHRSPVQQLMDAAGAYGTAGRSRLHRRASRGGEAMSKRPTLAECIGVPERWQALACLHTMLDSVPGSPWAWGWSARASTAILCGDADIMRQLANYALDVAADDSEEPEPDRAICRLIAWELACELVERRKREREQEQEA